MPKTTKFAEYLSEKLLKIIEQQWIVLRNAGQSCVIAHRAKCFFSIKIIFKISPNFSLHPGILENWTSLV